MICAPHRASRWGSGGCARRPPGACHRGEEDHQLRATPTTLPATGWLGSICRDAGTRLPKSDGWLGTSAASPKRADMCAHWGRTAAQTTAPWTPTAGSPTRANRLAARRASLAVFGGVTDNSARKATGGQRPLRLVQQCRRRLSGRKVRHGSLWRASLRSRNSCKLIAREPLWQKMAR
jgi:hypothetical protein